MPLEAKQRKSWGAKIDIINTLSMAMVKIFSQLYIIPIMADRYVSLSAMLCSMAEIDKYTFHFQ